MGTAFSSLSREQLAEPGTDRRLAPARRMRPPISAPSSSSSQNPSSPAPPSPSSLPPTAPCLSQAAVASSDQMPSLPSPMKKHNGKKINAYTGYREIRSCHYCNTPCHLQMNCRQKIMDEGIAKDSTDDDDARQAEAYLASNIACVEPGLSNSSWALYLVAFLCGPQHLRGCKLGYKSGWKPLSPVYTV